MASDKEQQSKPEAAKPIADEALDQATGAGKTPPPPPPSPSPPPPSSGNRVLGNFIGT